MNKQILLQKLSLIKKLCNEVAHELGEDLNDMLVTKSLTDINENFHPLKNLLLSEAWPKAVPQELMCDEHNEKDKLDRANGIIAIFLTELVEDKRFLDFGTGNGHLPYAAIKNGAKFAVGYDMASDFSLNSTENLVYTTLWNEVVENGQYDIITLFDVFDHLEYETPVNVLLNLKTILSPTGKIYIRYHPFIAKHGAHLYKKLNKAFMHLVFTEHELQLIMPDYNPVANMSVIHPLKTYKEYAENSGFKVIGEKITKSTVDEFFKNEMISKRICELTGTKILPEQQMEVEFVDHILSMN